MTDATFGVLIGQVSGAVAAGSGVVYGSHGIGIATCVAAAWLRWLAQPAPPWTPPRSATPPVVPTTEPAAPTRGADTDFEFVLLRNEVVRRALLFARACEQNAAARSVAERCLILSVRDFNRFAERPQTAGHEVRP